MILVLTLAILASINLVYKHSRRRGRRRNYRRDRSHKRRVRRRYVEEEEDEDDWILQEDLWDDYDY